jgi:hypothetical protein
LGIILWIGFDSVAPRGEIRVRGPVDAAPLSIDFFPDQPDRTAAAFRATNRRLIALRD